MHNVEHHRVYKIRFSFQFQFVGGEGGKAGAWQLSIPQVRPCPTANINQEWGASI